MRVNREEVRVPLDIEAWSRVHNVRKSPERHPTTSQSVSVQKINGPPFGGIAIVRLAPAPFPPSRGRAINRGPTASACRYFPLGP